MIDGSARQGLILVGVVYLLLTVPLLAYLSNSELLDRLYVQEFVAPSLQLRLGFSARALEVKGSSHPLVVIDHVVPGSVLDLGGVQPGDVPVFLHHGFVTEFYRNIEKVESGTCVRLRLTTEIAIRDGSFATRQVDVGSSCIRWASR